MHFQSQLEEASSVLESVHPKSFELLLQFFLEKRIAPRVAKWNWLFYLHHIEGHIWQMSILEFCESMDSVFLYEKRDILY